MTRLLVAYRRQISVAAVYLAILALLALVRRDYFNRQIFDVFIDSAPVLIAGIGMTLVIICRQIDISIGSQFSVCAVLAAVAVQMHLPMPVAVLLAVVAGAVFGTVNGFLVAYVELPSIVVTLATMVLLRESLSLIREGAPVNGLPDYFQWFGASQLVGQYIIVSVALLVWLKFLLASRYSTAGRSVFAVGSDFEAARLAGLQPKDVTFAVFVLMGVLTAVAAVLGAIRLPSVDVATGTGLELKVIAAVVVGGTAISGGRGSFLGTLLGVLLLGTIGSALLFLFSTTVDSPIHGGVLVRRFFLFLGTHGKGASYWERAVQGIIILVAVATDALERKRAV